MTSNPRGLYSMIIAATLSLTLALASCAPSPAQTQAAQYVAASIPPPAFQAAPAIGQTSIYDAIVLATGESRKGHYASKVILLITDGVDNSSTVKDQDAVKALRATGVRIYAIGIGDPNSKDRMGIALGPFILGGNTD